MEFNEKEGWEEIKTSDAERWCPEKAGDELVGLYVEKRENLGKNHANGYFITNVIEGEEKEWLVFGTEDLNRKLEHVPIGYEVGIVFAGTKPSTPPKKPFKVFKVYKRPAPGSTPTDEEATTPKVERVTEKPEMFSSENEMELWAVIDEIASEVQGPVNNDTIIMQARRWKSKDQIDQEELDKIKEALSKNPFEKRG